MSAGLNKVFKEIELRFKKANSQSKEAKDKLNNRRKAHYYNRLLNKKRKP